MSSQRGFTLIEVMVAMAIMALIGAMSWAGLDVLIRSQHQVQAHGLQTAQMQIALQQWSLDLDQAWYPDGTEPMGWDGKAFRLMRRAPQTQQGVVVVAWAVRSTQEGSYLMRWQSQPFIAMEQWRQAWEQASNWARSTEQAQDVQLMPATQLDIFVWSGNTWVNGLSSETQTTRRSGSGLSRFINRSKQQPQGVRMMLSTSNGVLAKDWGALTFSEAKS